MNRCCAFLISIMFITSGLWAIAPEDLYSSSIKSIVVIFAKKDGGDFVGTGFFAFSPDLVLTCFHLVKDSRELLVKDASGNIIKVAGIVDYSEKFDLAILKCEDLGKPPIEIESELPVVGSKLYAIGCPKGLEFSLSDGIVSQIRNLGEGNHIQFTCPTSPGNSGGPILNAMGKVVGVVSWQYMGGQNLNFAVPVSFALTLNRQKPPQQFFTNKSNSSEFISDDNLSFKSHYDKAIEYFKKGLYEMAIQENTIALKMDPKNIEVLNNLANSYFKAKQINDAIGIWKTALKEMIDQKIPDSGKISNNLGIAYYQLDDFDNAEKFYLQAIDANMDFEDPYFNLGSLYGFQQKFEKAINCYKKFIAITKSPKMKKEAQEKLDFCRKNR